MKKLILSAVAVFALTFANAQEGEPTFGFSEGDFLIEGNINFSSTNNKNTEVKESSFNFNPKAGYFISDDIAIGLDLAFGSLCCMFDVHDISIFSFVGSGAFARDYLCDLGKRFKGYRMFGEEYATVKDGISQTEIKVKAF